MKFGGCASESTQKKSVALIYNSLDQWVIDDREILSSRYIVHEVFFNKNSVPLLARSLINTVRAVYRSDFVYYWFASHFSFFAALVAFVFRKPVIGVVSGYDMANRPDLQYGHLRGGINRMTVVLTTMMSDKLLAVSNFTYSQIAENLPRMLSKSFVVPHGFRPFQLSPIEKKRYIVTACSVSSQSMKLKGLGLYLSVAEKMPQYQFYLVGRIDEAFIATLKVPSNVILTGAVVNFATSALLREATVYMQLSEYESFGCAMAEAMLNECFPIATRRGALPEVLGSCGRLVEPKVEEICAVLDEVFAISHFPCREARVHIEKNFPFASRCVSVLFHSNSLLTH